MNTSYTLVSTVPCRWGVSYYFGMPTMNFMTIDLFCEDGYWYLALTGTSFYGVWCGDGVFPSWGNYIGSKPNTANKPPEGNYTLTFVGLPNLCSAATTITAALTCLVV